MTDWAKVRAQEFPALANWTYLNTATYGQMPRRAVQAMERHFARRDELVCSDYLDWFDDADGIRAAIARMVHAEPGDIAYFQNASSALSTLVGGMTWAAGDRVLTLEDEFPNHLYWGEHLATRGVHFDVVPYTRFAEALTERTRLVMVSTVNYSTGLLAPVERMSRLCQANGTVFYVDGTQSAGALEFDFAAVQPDMFAVDGYKWLLCPNGAGFACVHPRLREWLTPSCIGWRSDRNWRSVASLNHGAPEFKSEAERYEGGILPMPAIYGMGGAVDLFLELTPAAIEARVNELATYARDRMRAMGAELPSDSDEQYLSPVIASVWPGRDVDAMSRALKAQRVVTAVRHGHLRVSTHFYNNEADIDRLCEVLQPLV